MKNIAILGCGVIASIMARTLREMKKRGAPICLYAAAARTLDRAQAFCEKEGFEKAYGSYEEMVRDERIDLIYIATPHSHHAEQAKLCLSHGKAILCEKAFTVNARQAREVLALAREKNVLVAEAIWPRYMPSRKVICDLLDSGAIGTPQLLTASLSGYAEDIERIYNPALAGGALLDVGIYPLTFMSMFFGNDFVRMESTVQLMETGVDRQENFSLYYADGRMANLSAGTTCRSDRSCLISGSEGYITVDNVNNPAKITLYLSKENHAVAHDVPVPPQLTGYEYQVRSCMKALAEGAIECPEMPHSESVRIMEICDELRAQWGVKYPFE